MTNPAYFTLPNEQNLSMRKQYHFWRGENGLDAWNVDHLIEMTAGLPVQEVPLEAIWEIDSSYWFEGGGSERPTVRNIVEHFRLTQEVDPTYPIVLGPDGRVMDGMHRIARALLEGHSSILAVRLETLPPSDFQNCRPEELPYD